jgi:hypothetical protein
MLTETRPFREKGWNLHVLANSRWKMLFKAVEKPLGTAKKV